MGATVFHVKTSAIPDDADTSLIRPSDWNSAHVVQFSQDVSLYGNTAGASTAQGAGLFLAGGNNITLSANAGTVSIIGGAGGGGGGAAISAGTQSQSTGTVAFSNSNGISFGLNAGTLTASYTVPTQTVDTNKAGTGFTTTTAAGIVIVGTNDTLGLKLAVPSFLTTAQPVGAYLTTARASNDAIGLNTALTANGVSMTANSSGLSLNFPAFLTTAANSTHSHNFATTTTNGSQIVVGTANSAGATIGVPPFLTTAQAPGAYLTTAAQSDHTHGNVAFNLTNISATANSASNGLTLSLSAGAGGAGDGYNSAQFTNSTANSTMPLVWAGNSNGSGNVTVGLTGSTITMSAPTGGGGGAAISAGTSSQNTGTVAFSNSNGITFGLDNGTLTASHNGLTTAALSNHSHAFATTTTNGANIVVGTTNSAGVTIGVPAFLTTAQAPGAYLTTARASNDAIGLNTALTAGPAAVTANSSGLSLNFGSVAGTSTGFTGGNSISGSMTHNTAGLAISLAHPAWLTTAQPVGAYLTTARASNDAVGLNTAGTNVTWTVNSSGISLNAGAYLTTAAQSNHSHGNPTLALTNINGTTASASNGLTLSLSAVVPAQTNQTANFYANGNTTQLSSTAGVDLRSVSFEGAGIASVGVSGGKVMVSVPSGGGAGDGYNILALNTAAGNTSGATASYLSATMFLQGGNNVTLSQTSNTIVVSAGAGGAAASAFYAIPPWGGVSALITNVTAIDKRAFFVPFQNIGNLSVQEIMFPMSRSTSGSNAFTIQYGIYSYANSTALSLISSEQDVFSHTATASQSGIRLFEAIFDNTFTIPPGQYAVGMWFSANGGNTASMNYSLIGGTTANPYVGVIHPGTDNYFTHTTHGAIQMFGRHSVTSASLPTSMAQSNLFGAYTGSNQPIPLAFTIGTHN